MVFELQTQALYLHPGTLYFHNTHNQHPGNSSRHDRFPHISILIPRPKPGCCIGKEARGSWECWCLRHSKPDARRYPQHCASCMMVVQVPFPKTWNTKRGPTKTSILVVVAAVEVRVCLGKGSAECWGAGGIVELGICWPIIRTLWKKPQARVCFQPGMWVGDL